MLTEVGLEEPAGGSRDKLDTVASQYPSSATLRAQVDLLALPEDGVVRTFVVRVAPCSLTPQAGRSRSGGAVR
jgi:hypothetical protein